jgi:hypothetical protein
MEYENCPKCGCKTKDLQRHYFHSAILGENCGNLKVTTIQEGDHA